jgi:N-acetylneuraminate lyase
MLSWQGFNVGRQRQGKRLSEEEANRMRAELTEAVKGDGVLDTFGLLPSIPLLRGVIPAILTPFTENGDLHLPGIAPLVEKLIADGATGFFVTGNTGEGFACSIDERKAVAEEMVRVVKKRVPLIAHVGAASGGTADAVVLAKHAHAIGFDAVSSVVPPNGDEPVKHFAAIGEASPLPFYVYHFAAPGDISAEAFLQDMKRVPNFAGIKFTSKDFFTFEQLVAHKQRICGGGPINALTGPDEMAVAGRIMGADGCIGSTFNVQTRTLTAIYDALDRGDMVRARQLQSQANKVIEILVRYCDCASRGYNITEGLKVMLSWQGFNVGRQRQGKRLSEEEANKMRAELTEAVKGDGVLDTFGLL